MLSIRAELCPHPHTLCSCLSVQHSRLMVDQTGMMHSLSYVILHSLTLCLYSFTFGVKVTTILFLFPQRSMASLKPLIIPKKPVGLASPTGFISLESQIQSIADITPSSQQQDAPPGGPPADAAPPADATPGAPPVVSSAGDAEKPKAEDKEKEIAILARNTRKLLNVSCRE